MSESLIRGTWTLKRMGKLEGRKYTRIAGSLFERKYKKNVLKKKSKLNFNVFI